MAAAEYRKLVVVVWVIVAAAMGAIWGPKAWSGKSWDSDDFMRLVQVRDLLAGQAWSDLTQHRLDPPNGTLLHWSRLPDVPIALVRLALTPVLGPQDAVRAAAMVIPPAYLLLFLAFFGYAARLMLGPARSPMALLVAIGGSIGIVQFVPGRIDHHGLQLIAMMAAMTLLVFGLARERWGKAIAWAGVPFALSIWIGAETLPLIAAWFAALGLAWCYVGGRLAGYGAICGLLGAGIGVGILITSMPQASWFSPVCDGFSLMPIGMLALLGAGFAGMAILGRSAQSPLARLIIAAPCGVVVGGAFALAFPACLRGGLESVDPLVMDRWLSHVVEAMPLSTQLAKYPFQGLMSVWTPLLGLGYCAWRLVRGGRHARVLWGAVAVLVLAATALLIWQVRAVTFAQELALLPLSGLVGDVWGHMRRSWVRWARIVAGPVLLYVCSLLFWPSIQAVYSAAAAVLPGAPAPKTLATMPCPTIGTLAPLQDSGPTVILSYIDIGSMLLFNTPHSVLGAPYHRDNDGLRTTIELFSSNDDAWIKARMRERGVGWVVTCPGLEERTVFRTENREGLAERLASGQVPNYLEEVADPAHPSMRFYRVRAGE
ncbi:MAG: hypothetical protein R3D05_17340 [Dongiaceae bacterium]